jgi:hypothetical protein
VEKYGTARQATDDNIIRRMRFACRITKATDTRSEYLTLIAFHGNNGYANAPQYLMYLDFLHRFAQNTQISDLMKVCPVGTEFCADGRTDGRTDRHDEVIIVAFRSFANARINSHI